MKWIHLLIKSNTSTRWVRIQLLPYITGCSQSTPTVVLSTPPIHLRQQQVKASLRSTSSRWCRIVQSRTKILLQGRLPQCKMLRILLTRQRVWIATLPRDSPGKSRAAHHWSIHSWTRARQVLLWCRASRVKVWIMRAQLRTAVVMTKSWVNSSFRLSLTSLSISQTP